MLDSAPEVNQQVRANVAYNRRQESIRRWEGSETAQTTEHRSVDRNKVKFNDRIVFLCAVTNNDEDEVLRLIKKNVDINCCNVDGLTALHRACIYECMDMVKLLVSNGADVNVRDNEGWTPLHAAASSGKADIVQYLVEHSADLLAVNNEGELALDLAEDPCLSDYMKKEAEKQKLVLDGVREEEMRRMLEDAKRWLGKQHVDECLDWQGATPLHVASAKGYIEVISLLLKAGINVNSQDHDGWTPLHAAVNWYEMEAVSVLCDAGADFRIKNLIGQTPMDLAKEASAQEELKVLKDKQQQKGIVNYLEQPEFPMDSSKIFALLSRPPSKPSIKDLSSTAGDSAHSTVSSTGGKIVPDKSETHDKKKVNNYEDAGADDGSEADRVPAVSHAASNLRSNAVNVLKSPLRPSSAGPSSPDNSLSAVLSPPSLPKKSDSSPVTSKPASTLSSSLLSAPSRPKSTDAAAATEAGHGSTPSVLSRLGLGEVPLPSSRRAPETKVDTQNSKPFDISTIPRPSRSTATSSDFESGKAVNDTADILERLKLTKPARPSERASTVTPSDPGPIVPSTNSVQLSKPSTPATEPAATAASNSVQDRYRHLLDRTQTDKTAGDSKPKETPTSRTSLATLRAKEEAAASAAVVPTPEKDARPAASSIIRGSVTSSDSQIESMSQKDKPSGLDLAGTARSSASSKVDPVPTRDELAAKNTLKTTSDDPGSGDVLQQDDHNRLSAVQISRRVRNLRERRRATGILVFHGEGEEDKEEKPEKQEKSISERVKERLKAARGTDSGSHDAQSKSGTQDPNPEIPVATQLQEALAQLADLKAKLDRANQEKEELVKKLSQHEDDVKRMQSLREENERLKTENGSLMRVVSKLSSSR